MQQLTLFSKNTALSLNRRPSRRRKNDLADRMAGRGWDLWSQETEVEKEMALFFPGHPEFHAAC